MKIFTELTDFLKLMNPISLFQDIEEFYSMNSFMKGVLTEEKVLKNLKKNETEILRIDSLNRIYTIVNYPVDANNEKLQFQFLVDAYRRIDEILLECRLNDIMKPYSTKYEDRNFWLVILSPYSFHINWKYIIYRIICIIFWLIMIILLITKVHFN